MSIIFVVSMLLPYSVGLAATALNTFVNLISTDSSNEQVPGPLRAKRAEQPNKLFHLLFSFTRCPITKEPMIIVIPATPARIVARDLF